MTKLLLVDADTILYSAAAMQQTNKCLATNITQQRTKLFESKTAFNEWAKENNRDKSNYSFETVSEISGEPRFAFQTIKQKIDKIVEASGCTDYKVCIQGEGNFRKDYKSKFVDYKGQRTAKPLLFHECFEFMEKKYKGRCVVTIDQETDDYVNIMSWEAKRNNTQDNLVVAYVDKDITANGQGYYLNYNKLENGIFFQTEIKQQLEFWTQVIIGDAADNIMGLEEIHPDTKQKYGIKTKGVGPVAANKLLEGCSDEKEMVNRVIEAYTLTHPKDSLQRLSDTCFFLYLRRFENEVFNFNNYVESLK